MVPFKTRIINGLAKFIPSVEGFEATPYWDVSRWSWGYGTEAPGPNGTITREQAFAEMLTHFLDDYQVLKAKVTRSLSVNQWVAYLDFSYNEGVGAAERLLAHINAHDDGALSDQWHQYIYADGVVNDDLVRRRAKEWNLWIS